MTVAEFLARVSSQELTDWQGFFHIINEEQEDEATKARLEAEAEGGE